MMALLGVGSDTPVYEPMQAFTFTGTPADALCEGTLESGILIQPSPGEDSVQIEINGVELVLNNTTVFVQSQPRGVLTIEVLSGDAYIMVDTFEMRLTAGARVNVPMTDTNVPDDVPFIDSYTVEDVANLPLALLHDMIDPLAPLARPVSVIVGVEPCAVVADQGLTSCPLHFLNPDGAAIVSMEVEFVSAAQGEWTGSIHDAPEILSGDVTAGVLSWDTTCTLSGGLNFIGPVNWSITITDEAGHVSEAFPAQFNCVEGE